MKETASAVDQTQKLVAAIPPLVKLLLELQTNLEELLPRVTALHESTVAGETTLPPAPASQSQSQEGEKAHKHNK